MNLSALLFLIQQYIIEYKRDVVFRNDQLNLKMTLSADDYSTSCYQNQYFTRCDSNLNVQNIPRYITHNLPCPFDSTLCRENDTTDRLQ